MSDKYIFGGHKHPPNELTSEALDQQIAAYLAAGNTIEQVPTHVMAVKDVGSPHARAARNRRARRGKR